MQMAAWPSNVFASGHIARLASGIAHQEKASIEKDQGVKVGAAQFAAMRGMAKAAIGLDILERLLPAGNA